MKKVPKKFVETLSGTEFSVSFQKSKSLGIAVEKRKDMDEVNRTANNINVTETYVFKYPSRYVAL